jgi:hypothetical protein
MKKLFFELKIVERLAIQAFLRPLAVPEAPR